MRIGIDASNIRAGGGVTHLVELLREAKPFEHGFSQVIVWSGHSTLDRIENKPWLKKEHQRLLDKGLSYRIFWQRFKLSKLARANGCDVLLVPGGTYVGDFYPFVTMSRNLLPFERRELRRYGCSLMALKLRILRITQSRTFRKADGLIFLTQHAHDVVTPIIKSTLGQMAIIPHGINRQFVCPPRAQMHISQYSVDRPFRILYVSSIDMYKHQWHVVEAVAELRKKGLPVVLDLIGLAYPPALIRLMKILEQADPAGVFVRYLGEVNYDELNKEYAGADLFVFASSCENMPNILLEAMVSGLPIACSDHGPMTDVLGDAGIYFDPENPDDLTRALNELIASPDLRAKLARVAFNRARVYSWERCAQETFTFVSETARRKQTV